MIKSEFVKNQEMFLLTDSRQRSNSYYMRICFIGPVNSSHIVKWVTWFSNHGHEVHVISFEEGHILGAKVHSIDVGVKATDNDIKKLKYLFAAKKVKELIDYLKPDIINAHYATSYGIVTALSGVKKYILSVWGSDVYDFPQKSFLHKTLLKCSLKNASYLFSTSQAMADEASKYTDKKFEITPFGVDVNLFNPDKRTRITQDDSLVIGTVKGLSDKYGISYLLHATAEIKNQGIIPIKLRIAGKGPQEQEYKQLAKELGISDITTWLGFISQEQAAQEWANMDVAIVPSTLESESFGVSAVEAQACGTPVIISDIPGLMEATKPGETSVVVKRKDSHAIAEAINELYKDAEKRKKMAQRSVIFVRKTYELDFCFEKIEKLYEKQICKSR